MRPMIASQMNLMHQLVQAKMEMVQGILSFLMVAPAPMPMVAQQQTAALWSWMNQMERRSQKGIS